jgi:hypothetical protein
MTTFEGPLGMLPPTDDRHRRLYQLTDETLPTVPTPGVAASNWYTAFDSPHTDADGNRWLVAPGVTTFGRVRGGHCYCIAEKSMGDRKAWWQFYDQGSEGACVGYGVCRSLTLMHRVRYSGYTLYKAAQRVDEWAGEDYDGTSTRAGLDIAREVGPHTVRMKQGVPVEKGPLPEHGISANRWATTIEDIAASLSPADAGAAILNRGWFEMLNSWGTRYPWRTRIDIEVAYRLWFRENGEYGVIVDR